ncbi:MAG: 50S ribosomal protein L18 [Simkania sp.]|jgi:large subunit ribosomal protein L18|nr:50S ribosomal protein L18 [Simkania negevensis]MCB1067266.1 50S ribosomal protein L18 [Simkania sp.]MCB1074433.1 50S ribosomal protein L18 [Simkania sp.]MCB1083926.1 50S ribosomal protein L18 [Simkania sp.]MCP5489703.1 50S ribosomal protein L18 [Chlamydiales bacterium]
MMNQIRKRTIIRKKRMQRIRKKLRGSPDRPRLCIFKSHKHIGGQIIDDEAGITLVGFSTLSKGAKGQKKSKEGARFVGAKLAELAKEKNIEHVVFDRGRFKFHGIIAELADAARENGLKF